MFDIGFLELLVIGVLGLLVLGPERLPVAARTLGLFIGRIKRSVSNFQDDLDRHVRTEELKRKLLDPEATFMDDDVRNPASLKSNTASEAISPDKTDETSPLSTHDVGNGVVDPKNSDSNRKSS